MNYISSILNWLEFGKLSDSLIYEGAISYSRIWIKSSTKIFVHNSIEEHHIILGNNACFLK